MLYKRETELLINESTKIQGITRVRILSNLETIVTINNVSSALADYIRSVAFNTIDYDIYSVKTKGVPGVHAKLNILHKAYAGNYSVILIKEDKEFVRISYVTQDVITAILNNISFADETIRVKLVQED